MSSLTLIDFDSFLVLSQPRLLKIWNTSPLRNNGKYLHFIMVPVIHFWITASTSNKLQNKENLWPLLLSETVGLVNYQHKTPSAHSFTGRTEVKENSSRPGFTQLNFTTPAFGTTLSENQPLFWTSHFKKKNARKQKEDPEKASGVCMCMEPSISFSFCVIWTMATRNNV